MTDQISVRQLRLCVTASDYDQALRLYRDVLGLPEQASYASAGGRVTILNAGVATLELADPVYAEYIDQVEVGSRVAEHVRVAFEVQDAQAVTANLAAAGADVIAPPTRTPWHSLNARLAAPAGLPSPSWARRVADHSPDIKRATRGMSGRRCRSAPEARSGCGRSTS